MLKGMKQYVQPHHQMTPDAVSVFIGYLVDEFTKHIFRSLFSILPLEREI